MASRISAVTLTVRDPARAAEFYREGLGLTVALAAGEGTRAGDVPEVDPALELRQVPRAERWRPRPRCCGAITLGLSAATRDEVDRLLVEAIDAGATLLRPALAGSRGDYSGAFTDLDGYPWEVRCRPAPRGASGRR